MSATATLPLPLELTQPVELSSSLEDALKEVFEVVNTKYNPETQVRENPEGIPQILNDQHTHSSGRCNTAAGGVITIDVDVVIDDNDIL